MAIFYEYDVLDDFPDQKVDADALQQQAEAVGLNTVLYINTLWNGDPARDKVDVWFSGSLIPGDKTILDGVVADHNGDPIIAPDVTDVPIAARGFQIHNEIEQDFDVALDRDGVGNMTFMDKNTTTKTLAELATAGQPDLSKVVLERSGVLVYIGDGDIITVR